MGKYSNMIARVGVDATRKAFLKDKLRMSSLQWPPRGEAMKAARVERGRYQCAGCPSIVTNKEMKLDHIEPVVPIPDALSGVRAGVPNPEARKIDLGSYVLRMFPEAEGFQVLCGGCHDKKTAREQAKRVEARRAAKQAAGK